MNIKNKPESFFKEKLTEEQYNILRNKDREAPFTGELLHNKKEGTYTCAACENILFSSNQKYDSASGWPSFFDVIKQGAVELKEDNTHGMARTEVLCSNCGSHLGHLFEDGPSDKTGVRYCINSASLSFNEEKEENNS